MPIQDGVADRSNERHADDENINSRTSTPDLLEETASEGGEEGESDKQCSGSMSPSIEALEDLILEAYNNMQSDGEYIFLPDEVAEKLHHAAHLMQKDVVPCDEPSSRPPCHIDRLPVDEVVQEMNVLSVESKDVQEPEAEQNAEADEDVTKPIARIRSSDSLFTELPPVLELDEENFSDTASRDGDNSFRQIPTRRKSFSPAHPTLTPNGSVTSISSRASNRTKIPLSFDPPTTPTKDEKAAHDAKVSAYEKRREAAQKLKEEKANREKRAREAARKQREDARRKLEEAQRKQMEERRERVKRIREQRKMGK